MNKVEETKKYTLDQVLEMLGGEKYFSNDQIMYVYHGINGHIKEAAYYKQICVDNARKEDVKYSILKTEDEIKSINATNMIADNNNVKNTIVDDDEDERPVKIKRNKINSNNI